MRRAARWGFTGKQVIHPGQVDIVLAAFTPAKDQVAMDREVGDTEAVAMEVSLELTPFYPESRK